MRVGIAGQGAEQTGAVFDLVACPFVLCSTVWRHTFTAQTSLYSDRSCQKRVAGAPIGAGRVDGCGCGLYIGCEKNIVLCWMQKSNQNKIICVYLCDYFLPVRLM